MDSMATITKSGIITIITNKNIKKQQIIAGPYPSLTYPPPLATNPTPIPPMPLYDAAITGILVVFLCILK